MKSKLFTFLLLACGLLAFVLRGGEPAPRDLQSQLSEARAHLDALHQKYTDDHPMVIEQRAKIAALEKQLGGDPLKPARDALQLVAPKPITFSIDFPGGTVRDLLDTVAKVEGVSLSIIANEPGDLSAPLPAFSLRNSSVQTALMALIRLLEVRGYNLNPVGMELNSVVAVLARQEASKPPRQAPTQFESYQLAPYLADQSIDDIIGAIRTAWELDPQHDPNALHLKFHPPTSILLIAGPRDGLDLALKIISQLKRSPSADAQRRQAVSDEVVRRRQEHEKTAPKAAPPADK